MFPAVINLKVEVVTNVRSSIGSKARDICLSTRNVLLLFQAPLCSWQEFRYKQGRTGHVHQREFQVSSMPYRPERASISAQTHTLALGVACDSAPRLRARLLSVKPLPATVQSNARPSSTTWFHCPRYHVLATPPRETTLRRHLQNQRPMTSACCKSKCLVLRHAESQRLNTHTHCAHTHVASPLAARNTLSERNTLSAHSVCQPLSGLVHRPTLPFVLSLSRSLKVPRCVNKNNKGADMNTIQNSKMAPKSFRALARSAHRRCQISHTLRNFNGDSKHHSL